MNIHRPTCGRAEVFGRDSRRLSPRDLAQIGYVSENQELPDWMTVEYLMTYVKPFYPSWDASLAWQLLREFNLPLNRKLRRMSNGMRMKAAVASSLAYRPRLIILDDPFAGIDSTARGELLWGISEFREDATMLVAARDLTDFEETATHVGFLDRGRLQFSESTDSLSARFRQIEITFDAAPAAAGPWPSSWVDTEKSSAALRFVDTQFEEARTLAEIRRLFPAAKQISARAMPLRSIFLILTQTAKKES
jgi:ABC-2 type transport system ATP-binding protein